MTLVFFLFRSKSIENGFLARNDRASLDDICVEPALGRLLLCGIRERLLAHGWTFEWILRD